MLFIHCDSLLHYIIRQAPFGKAKLSDDDIEIDFGTQTTPQDKVAVIATLPLTNNENWQQFAASEMAMFQNGNIIHQRQPENLFYPDIETGLNWAKQAV